MNPSTALRSLSRASQNALRIQAGGLGLGRASQRTIWPAPSSILQKRAVPAAKQPAGLSIRFHSTDASSQPAKPLTDRETTPEQDTKSAKDAIAARKAEEPAYEMTFTCKKCLERSSHRITKQAYHFGTVLVTCPGCKNRHLISDHMKVGSSTGGEDWDSTRWLTLRHADLQRQRHHHRGHHEREGTIHQEGLAGS